MNVLFIHSTYDINNPLRPLRTPQELQFGISYISALLKRHGHKTKLVVLSRMRGEKNKEVLDKYIKEFSPGLICFTAVSSEYRFIADTARYIKDNYSHIYLLAGGPHVSLRPEEAISESFDALCIGEGEYPTLELAAQLKEGGFASAIANLWIKHNGKIEKNRLRPFLEDLDSLPFPDREMWGEWIEEDENCALPILLGRGCPFECTYCCNHALKRLTGGNYVRFRTVENILQEIKEVNAKYPEKRNIYLEVETIGIDKEWTRDLCQELERFNTLLDKPLSFGANLRIAANVDYPELFLAFQKSNFKFINIGVESGSESLRRSVLNRHYSNQDIVQIVSHARKYGLRINFYNLIGIPNETLADFKETIRINRLCLPDNTLTHIFFPYPGTQLYSLCQEKGLLNGIAGTELERCKATLDLPGFRRKQIQKAFILFDYYVYRGYRPLYKILGKVTAAKFRSHIQLHSFYRRLTYLKFFKRLKRRLAKYIL